MAGKASRPLASLVATALLLCVTPPTLADGPPELGTVRWSRDFDAALAQAASGGKLVFALFQEVPGCATCVGFGRTVLSHPLLVDAIENQFVPVAVYNNGGDEDRRVLARYQEPSWNNPVVRFLASDGTDLIDRRDGVYDAATISARMIAALEGAGRPVPDSLALAHAELAGGVGRSATFAMPCFWAGEACLGRIDGVLKTTAAWLDGREVVVLRYDPRRVDYGALVERAAKLGCADAVFVRDQAERAAAETVFAERVVSSQQTAKAAKASDRKRSLARSPLAELDLTELQQVKINSALAAGEDPLRYLSERQRRAVAGR